MTSPSALRSNLALGFGVGLVALQVAVLANPSVRWSSAAGAALRWGLGAGLALIVLGLAVRVMAGTPPAVRRRTEAAVFDTLFACAAFALMLASLLRSPSRLAVNLLGTVLVGGPLYWITHRRVGPRAAALAMAALALFVTYPALQDLNLVARGGAAAVLATSFRWTVGWPSEQWVLAHEIELGRPWQGGPATLAIQRYGPYEGQSLVLASVNEVALGPMRETEFNALEVDVPEHALTGRRLMRFELRLSAVDQRLRLVAHRWTAGATRGARASSFFDGHAWHFGTFDDVRGRSEAGVYVLDLKRRV